ncbi:MAG: hypothetical protein HC849_33120 [Oscillatoriales cyanobacterium RU_3_3]|nr:hypothetical protein [Oscillatoriales cyanobacterium RU_3_3]
MHTSLHQLMATLAQPQATTAQLQTAANNFYSSLDIASAAEIEADGGNIG